MNLKKVVLELGGQDPLIVLEDADLEHAVQQSAMSRMANNAQACINAKRIFVHEQVYDAYREMLVREVREKFTLGDPLQKETLVGPMAREDLWLQLKKQVRDSLDHCTVVHGDTQQLHEHNHERGFFFSPIIVEDAAPDSVVAKEELFGPVFVLQRVKSADEAVRLANDSPYGLGGSVFTTDANKAEDVLRRLESGMVVANRMVVTDTRVPSGGIKASGFGRECGMAGIRSFTNQKAVWLY